MIILVALIDLVVIDMTLVKGLKFATAPGLYLKSLPGKYSYLSSSFDDNAEILAASVSRSY